VNATTSWFCIHHEPWRRTRKIFDSHWLIEFDVTRVSCVEPKRRGPSSYLFDNKAFLFQRTRIHCFLTQVRIQCELHSHVGCMYKQLYTRSTSSSRCVPFGLSAKFDPSRRVCLRVGSVCRHRLGAQGLVFITEFAFYEVELFLNNHLVGRSAAMNCCLKTVIECGSWVYEYAPRDWLWWQSHNTMNNWFAGSVIGNSDWV